MKSQDISPFHTSGFPLSLSTMTWLLFQSILCYMLDHIKPLVSRPHLMGWGSIYIRRMKVFSLALLIYLDYKSLKQREKWTSSSERAILWEKAHERNANRIVKLIIELEGMWVKMGQYFSVRADGLPGVYPRLLKQLQDSLPPRCLKEVCSTIQKELGKSMDDLFTSFVEKPLATTPVSILCNKNEEECIPFKDVITLSSEGSILRAWNLPDGQMVWESFLSGSKSSKALLTVPANLKVDQSDFCL